jgi:hypothetical protein
VDELTEGNLIHFKYYPFNNEIKFKYRYLIK